ncbi:alpha/beta fold hydrolase [Corynebacterium pacaense]|uniref:alpha/beta fold hydrolase n=1 Tax=Corynebacterium pacaense TaxID=1816684 RepID=UPI0009BB6E94|nr:alpha/beta fold hydrolase [Corynebacterium pacaense]
MSRRTLSLVLTAALVAGTPGVIHIPRAAANAVITENTQYDGDFYDWQGEIPAPGTLLRVADYAGSVPAGARALRILYATTRGDGSPAVASAVVAVPTTPPRSATRTVMAWQHGTTGVARACAPSLTPDALTEDAIPGISQAIERDWVVVATDYPGQGTAGRFPYLIGEGEGRSTLDAIRASRGLEGAQAGADALLFGHSQGGHATLFADQISASYAPELRIRGVAALSAAADPLFMARRILSTTSPLAPVVGSYVLVPYSEEYPDVRLGDYLFPGTEPLIRSFASTCVGDEGMTNAVLSSAGLTKVLPAPVINVNLDTTPAGARLRENIASGQGDAPLFLGQGTEDEVVPVDSQREMAQRAGETQRRVEVHEYLGGTHMSVIAADSPLLGDLFAWVDTLELR